MEEDDILSSLVSLEYLNNLKSELGGWESATDLCDVIPGPESLPIPDLVTKSIDLIRKKRQGRVEHFFENPLKKNNSKILKTYSI